MRKVRELLLTILLVILFTLGVNSRAEASGSDKRALFIGSYSYAWLSTQEQLEGLSVGLAKDIVIDYEFMDARRSADNVSKVLFYELVKHRLESVKPYDVLIVGDDAAFSFAMERREELFPNIPILFIGVNDVDYAEEMAIDPLITGIVEIFNYKKNIELGLKFKPDAQNVYAILDDSQTGNTERERFFAEKAEFPNLKFDEIDASQLTTTQLKIALQKIPEDSILIYVVCTEDASGKVYSDAEAIQTFTQYSTVPVMRMVATGVGQGLLGGYAVSMTESGKLIGQMATAIINGKDASSYKVMRESVNFYTLDMKVMQRYNFSTKGLYSNTIYINKPVSFTERNREVLLPTLIVGIFLLVILLILVVDNLKRRQILKKNIKMKDMLERASEHDFLTDLPNRSKFMSDLNGLIAEGRACTILMMDIDDFKSINDTYGHNAGDEALVELATRLKAIQSQILTPYRLAGDEFILILQSSQGKIVEKTAYQCRDMFTKPFDIANMKLKVCGSIGIASFPRDADTVEQVVICADKAMYAVKKSGKNDFAFYDPTRSEE